MPVQRTTAFVPVLLLALLVACAQTSSPLAPPAASAQSAQASRLAQWSVQYAALGEQGRVLRWDAAASQVRIHVYRGGRAERLGHNHVITAPAFSGYGFVPAAAGALGPFDALQGDIEVALDALVVDPPAGEAAAAPTHGAISPEAAAATREHMLGQDGLQAQAYPYVWLHVGPASGVLPLLAARVTMELHGRTQTWLLPLNVALEPGSVRVQGAFALRQSDFGVQPYTALGGLLAVRDELIVEFTLVGR